MWKLFKEFGTYGGLYGAMLLTSVVTSLIPLDPITCAGGAAVKKLRIAIKKNPRLLFCLPALLMITKDHMLSMWLDEYPHRAETATGDKWMAHLNYLVECGVLVQCAQEQVKWFGGYFAVPKSETAARAVWNGKTLSTFCKNPPPVNLPYLPDLLTRLAKDTARFRRMPTILVQDWSAFFHQIPISQEMSHFFGVKLDGWDPRNIWRWRTLPMGMKFSPYVAQSVGWACVLHSEHGEEELFLVPKELKSLPTFVPVKGGGFACLYYDNLLIVGFDNGVMERIAQRLERNQGPADRGGFNIIVKPGSYVFKFGKSLVTPTDDPDCVKTIPTDDPRYDPEEPTKLAIEPIDYLGAAIYGHRDSKGKITLRWKHHPSKLARWREITWPAFTCPSGFEGGIFPSHVSIVNKTVNFMSPRTDMERSPQGCWTPREIAALVGRILWRRSISLEPTCRAADIIAVLKRASTERCLLGGWDSRRFVLTESEALLLAEAWSRAMSNKSHTLPLRTDRQTNVFMATDASDNFLGRIRFDDQGRVIEEVSAPVPSSLLNVHIFLKELFAATWSVKSHQKAHPHDSFCYHVAIDNSAAASALRNMYSSNLIACRELDDLWETLTNAGSSIHIFSVRSEDNASDMASRNFDFSLMDSSQRARSLPNGRAGTEIITRCWNEIQAQLKGWRLGAHKEDFELTGDGIRHGELTNDAVSPEALWEDMDVLWN